MSAARGSGQRRARSIAKERMMRVMTIVWIVLLLVLLGAVAGFLMGWFELKADRSE